MLPAIYERSGLKAKELAEKKNIYSTTVLVFVFKGQPSRGSGKSSSCLQKSLEKPQRLML
jgi:hypothetical protein